MVQTRGVKPRPPAPAATTLLAWGVGLVVPVAVLPTWGDATTPVRLLAVTLVLAFALFAPRHDRLPQPILITLGAGLAVFAAASLMSATPALSLLGRYPRHEGLLLVTAYGMVVAVGATMFGPSSTAARDSLLRALSTASLINAVVATGQLALHPEDRVTGLMGNSTQLGAWGALTLGVLGWRLWSTFGWWRLIGAAAALACVVGSASRAALLAGLGAALLAGLLWWRSTRPRPAWAPVVVAGLLLTATLLLPTARARVVGATPFAEATVSGRLLLWQETLQLVTQHPWLGAGPSRFVDEINRFHTATWAASVGPYAPPDSPHNVVLQVAASTGLAGLVVFVVAAALVAGQLWRKGALSAWDAGAVTGVVALVGCYLFAFTDPVTTFVGALIAGSALGETRESGVAPPLARSRPWLAAAAGIPILVGCYGSVTLMIVENALGGSYGATQPQDDLRHAVASRPWDPDVGVRAGFQSNRLAENGVGTPEWPIGILGGCADLPSSLECLHVLGDAQDLSAQYRDALATEDAALAIDPTNVDTHLKRGVTLAQLGRYDEAEAAFLRAAELRPSAPEPWENLTQLYALTDQPDQETAASQRAADLASRR